MAGPQKKTPMLLSKEREDIVIKIINELVEKESEAKLGGGYRKAKS